MTSIVTWQSNESLLHGFTNTRHEVFITELGRKYLVSNKMIEKVKGAENVFNPTDMKVWTKFMQKMERSSNQELVEEVDLNDSGSIDRLAEIEKEAKRYETR